MVTIIENIRFTDFASGIRLWDCSKLAVNRENGNNVTIFRNDIITNFFDVVLFLLLNLLTGPSFMSISPLVLELWKFLFIRDWPEIRKSEIPPSEFCPISRDLGEFEIPNLVRTYVIKYYWMLQNARVTAFTVSGLSRENQQGGKITSPPPPPTQIRVKKLMPTV